MANWYWKAPPRGIAATHNCQCHARMRAQCGLIPLFFFLENLDSDFFVCNLENIEYHQLIKSTNNHTMLVRQNVCWAGFGMGSNGLQPLLWKYMTYQGRVEGHTATRSVGEKAKVPPQGSMGLGVLGGFHAALREEDLVSQRSCRMSTSKIARNVLIPPTQVSSQGNRRQVS